MSLGNGNGDKAPSVPPPRGEYPTLPEIQAQESWEDLARAYANMSGKLYETARREHAARVEIMARMERLEIVVGDMRTELQEALAKLSAFLARP